MSVRLRENSNDIGADCYALDDIDSQDATAQRQPRVTLQLSSVPNTIQQPIEFWRCRNNT